MGLFLDETTPAPRPPVDALAIASLIVAITGFVNVVGFLVGPVLAHIALIRIRGTGARGRPLAFGALWLSYGVLGIGAMTLLVILIMAYGRLPRPDFF